MAQRPPLTVAEREAIYYGKLNGTCIPHIVVEVNVVVFAGCLPPDYRIWNGVCWGRFSELRPCNEARMGLPALDDSHPTAGHDHEVRRRKLMTPRSPGTLTF